MKHSFLQAAVVSIMLYGCTTWTLTKRLEKKLDGNYTRMLRAILNKSWQQHPTRHQLYSQLPPVTKTIQVRRTRHAGHCWRSRDELISDVLQWTPTYGRAKAGRPAWTYIQHLCEDTGCSPEDLPEAMNDREKWWGRVRYINASGTTWWWWWWSLTVHTLFPSELQYLDTVDQKRHHWQIWYQPLKLSAYELSCIFLISGSNKQLQHESEHTLLKPDCHSWGISKMQSGREDTLEERYAIKFCFKLGKNATETYGMLQTAFRRFCMGI